MSVKGASVVDFANEVVSGNTCFQENDWHGAIAHYTKAVREIERQQKVRNIPLPNQVQILFKKVIFNLVESLLEAGDIDTAQTVLTQYPFLREAKEETRTNLLQARIYLQQNNNRSAKEVFKNLCPFSTDFEPYYLDSIFLLASCHLKDKEYTAANCQLQKAKDYLQNFSAHPEWAYYCVQVYFHLALVAKANNKDVVAQQYLQKAYDLFKENCDITKDSLDTRFAIIGIMLMSEMVRSADLFFDTTILSVVDEIACVLPKIHTLLNPEAKHYAVLALLRGIALNLSAENHSKAISLLNLVLPLEVTASNQLKVNILIAAATFYFHDHFLNIKLASKFIALAKRYAASPMPTMISAQMTILDLILNIHRNNTEVAKANFDELNRLTKSASAEEQVLIRQLFQKQLALLPKNYEVKDLEFYMQLCSFSLEGLTLEDPSVTPRPFTPGRSLAQSQRSSGSASSDKASDAPVYSRSASPNDCW